MISECFVSHFYCDNPHHDTLLKRTWEYTGANKTDTHRQAKRDGWVIHETELGMKFNLCPDCEISCTRKT